MPLTREEAMALQAERLLLVRPAADGWHADTAKGERLHRGGRPTPEEAVEAAVATLAAADAREEEYRARRLLEALDAGRYFLRPRTVTGTDPATGEPFARRVFDAFRPDNSPVAAVRGRESYAAAVVDMEAALAAEAPPAPAPAPDRERIR